MSINISLKQKMRQNSHLTSCVVFTDLTTLHVGRTTVKFFKKVFFGNKPSYKKVKVSEVRSSVLIFHETTAYKRKACANLRTPGMNG